MSEPLEALLVEDDPGDADLMRERLEEVPSAPIRLTHASSLGEALALLASRRFDVALVDLSLPDAPGLETIRRLHEAAPGLPLVIVTGLAEEVALAALREGAQDYLLKGQVNGQMLVRAVHYSVERVRAEEALRLRDRAMRAVTQGILITDPSRPDNPIVYASPGFERTTGYAEAEILGRNCRLLQGPGTDPAPVARVREAIRAGEAVQAELLNYRKDGTPFWNQLSVAPVRDGGRLTHFVAVQEDVTERRRTEDALRESEGRYRTLIEATFDAVAVHDDNVFVEANEGFARLLDLPLRDLLGRHILDFVAEESRDRMLEAIRAGDERPYEATLITSDGRRIDVEIIGRAHVFHGRAVRVAAVRDLTERKRAAEAVRQSEARFRAVFDQTFELVGILDPSGTILEVNRPSLEFRAVKAEDVVGLPLWESPWLSVTPETGEKLRRAVGRAAGGQFVREEVAVRDGAGTERLFDFSLKAATEAGGQVCLLIAEARDITEYQRLEEQFRQAQKMEAVGRLAGGVAHDFNNLLTVINGYSDLVLDTLPADSRCQGLIGEVRKAGERAAALTRQLLAFSRKQIVAPQVVSLNAFITEMEKMLHRLIGEDVELATALDPDLGRVEADPGQVQQVIMNLVVNARDAMPQGGKLTIETRNVELDESYTQAHAEVTAGPYALLAISDTGCGMTLEVRARAFEPFFTTKGEGKGTGLGLATVYGIVKQNKGHVEVYSEVGRGTTFKVYLPRVREIQPSAEQPPESFTIPSGTETVLLVEDEEGVRRLACLVLQSSGYTVLEAGDGDEALRLYGEHRGPIHLLVTDVVMPRTSGRVLADRLSARHPGLKVLFMSGYTDDAVVRHGILETGVPFLQKPFTPAGLARKVRDVLDQGSSGGRSQ